MLRKSKAVLTLLIPVLSRCPRPGALILYVCILFVVLVVTTVWVVYHYDCVDFDAISAALETTRVSQINDSSEEYVAEAGYLFPTPFINKYRTIAIHQFLSDQPNQLPSSITTNCSTVISGPTLTWVDAPEPQRWQPVSADSNDAFVFSAFSDTRWAPDGRIVIIGIASEYDNGGTRRRYCRIWFKGGDRPTIAKADFRFVPETHDRKYAAVFYTCHVTMKTPGDIPYAVSLVDDVCETNSSNLLRVLYNDPAAPPEVDFTVCLSVLHSGFDDDFRLTEAIEANRMFGAERFVVYDFETGSNIRRSISHYVKSGRFAVVAWNSLPVSCPELNGDNTWGIHYFGQLAAINDCLYRNLFRSTFILFADMDEIVVPRGSSDTWLELLESATAQWENESRYRRFPGAYSVRNAFFRPDECPGCLPERGSVRPMSALTLLERDEYVWRHGERSKYFVWTKIAVMAGIHFPYEMVSRDLVATVYLRPDEGLLHHYQVDRRPDTKTVPDNRMLRYSAALSRRISGNG